MKRYEEAIIEITKAIEHNKYFEKAYFQRGYCYELINDLINSFKVSIISLIIFKR